jgi:DNA-binding transcriptional regulator YdaS (Cro superfamily)
MEKDHIREIAASVGGVIALSIKLGLSRAAVSGWKRIPAERVADVERVTGIPREKLRPDLFQRSATEQTEAA